MGTTREILKLDEISYLSRTVNCFSKNYKGSCCLGDTKLILLKKFPVLQIKMKNVVTKGIIVVDKFGLIDFLVTDTIFS